MKSEALHARQKTAGISRRDRLIAGSARAAEHIAGWKARWVNAVQASPLFRAGFERWMGFDRRRPLPTFADAAFMKTIPATPSSAGNRKATVALYADTYSNFHETRVATAALRLLESLGFVVTCVRPGCCQRPRISHGFLDQAKRDGERTLRGLDALIQQGMTVVVLEPSCHSALTDDLPDLIEDVALADRIAQHVRPLEGFLADAFEAGDIQGSLKGLVSRVLIHGHCHQKALTGMTSLLALYRRAGVPAELIAAGCCGMAGSFGYEKEHYDLSVAIAKDRLLPAVERMAPGTQLVCAGFSCRHQIADLTGQAAVHWVETLVGDAAQ